MSTVVTTRSVLSVLDVASDSFSVDWQVSQTRQSRTDPPRPSCAVHTVLLFIPGNPGLIDWYSQFFERLVRHLGPGFCARGVANASHSLDESRIRCPHSSQNRAISWTVPGQVWHKATYIDRVLQDLEPKTGSGSSLSVRLIFISHSIGAHLTTRLLILRPDLLKRTRLLLNLMPFVRMDAPFPFQFLFDLGASRPALTIAVTSNLMRVIRAMPESIVQWIMKPKLRDVASREIGVRLLRQPDYAANFFALGSEEIRDVPEVFDVRIDGCSATVRMVRRVISRMRYYYCFADRRIAHNWIVRPDGFSFCQARPLVARMPPRGLGTTSETGGDPPTRCVVVAPRQALEARLCR